jgi:hypothetical protein
VDDDLVPGDDDTIADDDVLPGDASVPPDDGGADDDATDAGPEPEPSLPVGNPPMVQINHPGDGEVRDPCPDGFPFVAIATDTEDGDLAPDLDWTSSIDGPIGTGSSFDTCLSPGVHTVAASVEDSDGNIGTDAVTLTITGPVTPGGADPANDDFERGALGPDWEVIFPTSGNQVQVFDGALGMGPGPQGFFLVNWVASDFEADQYSEATMPDDVDPDWLHQPYVRWRPSDGARYGFGYNGDPVQATLGEWYFKYDGVSPADTRIIASTPAASVPGPGDVLRVEVEGWVLRGYFNDLLVLEATDTDPSRISTGRPGLAARWATGNTQTTDSVKVYESWSGGSL